MALLSVKNISKKFGSTSVLQGLNLDIEEGEFVAIIGYSGTGKTTLVNLLSGLAAPSEGEVTHAGKKITQPSPERAVVFQNYSLLPWLTVRQNIALAVDRVFPDRPSSDRAHHVDKYISMVKLSHAADKYPAELSGGMRQRVSVARALSMNSNVLLLDEPLSALDALTRATLQDEIGEIWRKNRTTVVWVTNDPDEALLLADRVVPLLPTSPATLGEPITISLERPRERTSVSQLPEYKQLRAHLVDTLLAAKAEHVEVTASLPAPDILPEDLRKVNSIQFLNRRGPKRRSDILTPQEAVA